MKLFYTVLLTCISLSFYGQTIEPSKATANNILVTETELSFSKAKDGAVTIKSWSVFNLLFRYGLLENIEINAALSNAKEETYVADILSKHHHKFDVIKVGALYNLNVFNKDNYEIALQTDVILPFDKGHENSNSVGYNLGLNLGTSLTDKWVLNSNIGYLKDVDKTNNYFYRFNLQYSLNEKLLLFTEHTANWHKDFDWTQSFGLGYYPSDWAFESVIGTGYNSPDLFIGCKIIKEFNLKKKAIN